MVVLSVFISASVRLTGRFASSDWKRSFLADL
jgi:hypothetical protein